MLNTEILGERNTPARPRRMRGLKLRQRFRGLARRVPCGSDGLACVGRRQIYILPTGAGVLFGGVLFLMLLGSLNYQNNLGLMFTFLMASVGLVAMHHTWFNLYGLQVGSRGGAPVFAGQDATFTVSLRDLGSRRRVDLVIRADRKGAPPTHLERQGNRVVNLLTATQHRGYQRLDWLCVDTRYPLGLFRAWCYVQTGARITVYPAPASRSPTPSLVPAHRHSNLGDLGVGADDFVGPRSYQPGDPLRRLDWKALARERGLVVKQFGGDCAAQVWIDWGRLPAVNTETRLGLLCRQVLDAAENGLSYGLHLPESTVPMGQGDAHRHNCLEALATFGHE